MANQLNYPEDLINSELQRPSRITNTDLQFIQRGNKNILFGTTSKDVVEVWVYNPDASFAGHTVLGVDSGLLTISTLVDSSGPYEILNIDIKTAMVQMGVLPGRYTIILNFFRNEIGSEEGNKLYISEISQDRTELKLKLVQPNQEGLKDVWEFGQASIPREISQALVDQMFKKSQDFLPHEVISKEIVLDVAKQFDGAIADKITYSGLSGQLDIIIQRAMDRIHPRVIEKLVEDIHNHNIQEQELHTYLAHVIHEEIQSMDLSLEGSGPIKLR